MNNYLVFDLETNGIGKFRPPTQTITQLAFIKFDSEGNNIDQFSSLVKGAKEINNNIPSVKFTLEQINSEGIELKTALERFLNSIDENTILYAHNAEFDSSIIKRDSINYGLKLPANKIVCTMRSSTNFCKIKNDYGYKWPSLNELANSLGVVNEEDSFHDAMYDCRITKNCVIRGLEEGIF